MRTLAIAALLLVACAEDLSARDYSDAACPAPVERGSTEVCDRGAGQTPRYVTGPTCLAELGVSIPRTGYGLHPSTHPNNARCRPLVDVYTLDDYTRAQF